MTSSKPLHCKTWTKPGPALAMARAAMQAGRNDGDLGLLRAGKILLDETNVAFDQVSPTTTSLSAPLGSDFSDLV